MFNDSVPEPGDGHRKHLLVSIVAFAIVGVYLGWVFYSRRQADQDVEEKTAEKQRVQNQQTFEMMGGNRFEILGFHANPASIPAGETSSLCYSVSNAKTVTLEPQSEPVWPAFSRCVHASPRKTTTYTLTIGDGAGHFKTATVEVRVH